MAAGNSAATVLTAIPKLRQVAQAVAAPANDVIDDGFGSLSWPIKECVDVFSAKHEMQKMWTRNRNDHFP
jgi:hypothetical protein